MIPLFKVFVNTESILKELKLVFDSGFIGQGQKVEEFENKLRNFFSKEHLITTNSATSAEHLFFHLAKLKFKTNDIDVLTTPLTCTATNWPILANNFRIKWVDIDPTTLNLDLDDLARKITSKTKIIVIVHWGGYPVDLCKLNSILDSCESKFGFRPLVLEDCAHAFGSRFNGSLIGTHGNFCSFSFQAIKHLTTGDGGLLTIPEYDDYRLMKLLRWYGIDRDEKRVDFRCEVDIKNWGFKFHMNDINATIGLENLKLIDSIVTKHKQNAAYFNKNLKSVPGVSLLENSLPEKESSYWLYTLLVEDRQNFIKRMSEKNIMVSRVHERNDIHTCVSDFSAFLPTLDVVSKKMICIPVGWWVTESDSEYICDTIKHGW